MHVTEVDSFVHKFHQLWNSGLKAHLDLDCYGGVTWVGLHVQLGHPPGPAHHYQDIPSRNQRKSFSPSYQRRRERKAEEHARINEIEKNADKASSIENAEEASNEKPEEVHKKNAEEASKVSETDDKSEKVMEIVLVEAVEAAIEKNYDHVNEQTEEVAANKMNDETMMV